MFNLAAKSRPYFGALVLSTALLTAGGIYSATRKPGMDLRNMELQVTVPLEQAVSTVIGVERVRSKTIRGGCDLSVDFSPGTDMRRAEQLTWNRIGAAPRLRLLSARSTDQEHSRRVVLQRGRRRPT